MPLSLRIELRTAPYAHSTVTVCLCAFDSLLLHFAAERTALLAVAGDGRFIGDDDFSPVPLLGVTAGVLIFTTIANVRAPPPPYIEAWPHRKRCGPGEGARSGAEAEREIAG